MSEQVTAKPVDGEERGIPNVGRPRQQGRWWWVLMVALAVVLAAALGVQSMMSSLRNRGAGAEKPAPATSTLPNLTSDAFKRLNEPAAPATTPTTATVSVPPPPPPAEPPS